jgi:hypothetical protein
MNHTKKLTQVFQKENCAVSDSRSGAPLAEKGIWLQSSEDTYRHPAEFLAYSALDPGYSTPVSERRQRQNSQPLLSGFPNKLVAAVIGS